MRAFFCHLNNKITAAERVGQLRVWQAVVCRMRVDDEGLEGYTESFRRAFALEEYNQLVRMCEQDTDLDVWRRLVDDTRTALLQSSRQKLLQVCEHLLQQWLRSFLQSRIVDVSAGADGELRIVPLAERQGGGQSKLQAIVNARKHPSTWKLGRTLAAQLEPVVNRSHDVGGTLPCPVACRCRRVASASSHCCTFLEFTAIITACQACLLRMRLSHFL
jgi:hypothetical protein